MRRETVRTDSMYSSERVAQSSFGEIIIVSLLLMSAVIPLFGVLSLYPPTWPTIFAGIVTIFLTFGWLIGSGAALNRVL